MGDNTSSVGFSKAISEKNNKTNYDSEKYKRNLILGIVFLILCILTSIAFIFTLGKMVFSK